ncbi:MAG: hypothetical protein M0R75_13590, partial [Dehalococcoidia bacterium]|nr:hypothetical protein [Dehalococcoidia bacterium]
MVQPTISPSERDLLREVMPDEAAELERREKRAADADLPRPALEDILEAQAALEAEWREWRFGTASTSGDEADADTAANLPADGIPGVHRIRAMRYHRDQMPAKWRRLLNGRTRFRSNLTSNEITRTVALATRNVPRVKVPADSDDPDAQAASENESRWAQALLPALERQASKPLLRMHADGIFESGLAFFEVYLTGAYDDLDLDQHDDEEEDSYARRTDEDMLRATKRRGLPVCVRVPDPLSVLYDDDDEGVYVATITERKSYRQVYSQLRRTLGAQKVEELRLPKPGKGAVLPQDYGMPGDSAQGDVTCIRYYDRRWYAYIVSGQIVDGPTEHGMPGVPVIVAWGDTTSSGRRAEQIQGVT